MNARPRILATAGHVDHGKSALVIALTGTDPDRLPEEKARGITIDLGFAHLELPDPRRSGDVFRVGVVDVPGHEDFVKNMVAGVGSIDAALLIVAADDGWMPQTEEHLQILLYLGVRHAVVALTKIDLISNEPAAIERIRERLVATALAAAPIIPTVAPLGRGIDALRTALAAALSEASTRADIGKPRLAVDRAFTLKGAGTVVTGTLVGGTLARGQAVVVQPAGTPARIRTLQSFGHDVSTAQPGTRTALNLPDLHVASRGDLGRQAATVARGDVITLAEIGLPTRLVGVAIDCLDRPSVDGVPIITLRHGSRVKLHQGTASVEARITLLDEGDIRPGQHRYAQLRLAGPLFLYTGDRFILRTSSDQSTIAGGVVLDPLPIRRRQRREHRRALLETLDQNLSSPPRLVEAVIAAGPQPRRTLLLQSAYSADQIRLAIDQLMAEGRAVVAGSVIAQPAWWQEVLSAARRAVDAEHAAHPERLGIALTDLRKAVEAATASFDLFDAVVGELTRAEFLRTGVVIRRSSHHPTLPPLLAVAGNRLRAVLTAKPFDPPSRRELAPDPAAQQALRFLLQSGEVIEISPELVLGASAYARAIAAVRRHLQQHTTATVSELKNVVGTSRRVMVPLAEKLDRDGVTLRKGDLRSLRVK